MEPEQKAPLDGQRAFAYISRALSAREHSSIEMRDSLLRKGYAPEVAQAAVSRAVRCGIIDDDRYAASFLRSKLSCGWSLQRIARELEQQGMDIEAIDGYPDEFVVQDEFERALDILSRHHSHSKDPYASCVRYLMGRGFSGDVAHRASKAHLSTAY